jgi:hypothetical protein
VGRLDDKVYAVDNRLFPYELSNILRKEGGLCPSPDTLPFTPQTTPQTPISEVIYFQMILAQVDDQKDSRSLGKFGDAVWVCGDRGCCD